MTELDDFRPRIRNWSRAFRTRHRQGTSPLEAVLRELRRQAGVVEPGWSEPSERIDFKDADLLDQCALKLSRDRLDVLRIEYLDRHPAEYESEREALVAERRKSRVLGLRSSKWWRSFVTDAETGLMLLVHNAEDKL